MLTYAAFPLLGGLAFHETVDAIGLTEADPSFYLLVFALFQFALAINFVMIAGYGCYVERMPFSTKLRVLPPVLPSEFASAMLAVAVAFIYHQIGIAAIALFGVVLITFQYLLGQLLLSQQRAEELERRTKQLASFQVGMLSAMLRTLDLRDQMTARHSAAVARYSRAIAQRAGLSRQEEELVHIAALLHDIGKFILPDRILKANVPLTDEDWMLIKRHPQQGARVVSSLDGYGPVAEIILAHHERIDGKGYPRGLDGDEIPELARIISVADTYDVMTARDSYRTPISTHEAMQELRRVAGKQLDAALRRDLHRAARGQGRLLPARRGRRLREGAGAGGADRRDREPGRRRRPLRRPRRQRRLEPPPTGLKPTHSDGHRPIGRGDTVRRDARCHLPGSRRGPGRGEGRSRAGRR